MSNSGQRRHRRYEVQDVHGALLFRTQVKVRNLSVSGLALETPERLQLGRTYAIRLAGDRRRRRRLRDDSLVPPRERAADGGRRAAGGLRGGPRLRGRLLGEGEGAPRLSRAPRRPFAAPEAHGALPRGGAPPRRARGALRLRGPQAEPFRDARENGPGGVARRRLRRWSSPCATGVVPLHGRVAYVQRDDAVKGEVATQLGMEFVEASDERAERPRGVHRERAGAAGRGRGPPGGLPASSLLESPRTPGARRPDADRHLERELGQGPEGAAPARSLGAAPARRRLPAGAEDRGGGLPVRGAARGRATRAPSSGRRPTTASRSSRARRRRTWRPASATAATKPRRASWRRPSAACASPRAYVPNGKEVGSEKWPYKLEWLAPARRLGRAARRADRRSSSAATSTSPPRSATSPTPRRGPIPSSATPTSARRWEALLAPGLVDSFRLHHAEGGPLLLVGLPDARLPEERRPADRPRPARPRRSRPRCTGAFDRPRRAEGEAPVRPRARLRRAGIALPAGPWRVRRFQPRGILPAFAESQASKVCSEGLSDRLSSRSRRPQNSSLKSRLNWNMLPRSSAPGKPNVR